MDIDYLKAILEFIASTSWPLLVLSVLIYLRKEILILLESFTHIINKANQEGVEINSPLIGNVNLKGNEKPNKPASKR